MHTSPLVSVSRTHAPIWRLLRGHGVPFEDGAVRVQRGEHRRERIGGEIGAHVRRRAEAGRVDAQHLDGQRRALAVEHAGLAHQRRGGIQAGAGDGCPAFALARAGEAREAARAHVAACGVGSPIDGRAFERPRQRREQHRRRRREQHEREDDARWPSRDGAQAPD